MRPRGAGTWEDLLGPQNPSSLCFLDASPCVWLGARMLVPRMCVLSSGWLTGTAQQPIQWMRSPTGSAEIDAQGQRVSCEPSLKDGRGCVCRQHARALWAEQGDKNRSEDVPPLMARTLDGWR